MPDWSRLVAEEIEHKRERGMNKIIQTEQHQRYTLGVFGEDGEIECLFILHPANTEWRRRSLS
jgi:hypothetical protein